MASSSATWEAGAVKLRAGRLADCDIIAQFINESAEGAVEYLFSGFNAKAAPIEYLASLLEQEIYYSYANTIVAEVQGSIVGIALSFPSSGLIMPAQVQQYTEQQLCYLRLFVDNKIRDSWHLDALCVAPEYRNCGIGTRLLAGVQEQARQYQFSTVSVFVFGSNEAAARLYQRNGFVDRAEFNTQSQEFLKSKKFLRLMAWQFQAGA